MGRPQPKARPRPNPRGGVWTPSASSEESLAWVLRPLHGAYPTGHVGVVLEFHFAGGNIGDGDNYEKLVLDALQKAGAYTNDSQVRQCSWQLHLCDDPFDERTVIGLWPLAVRG